MADRDPGLSAALVRLMTSGAELSALSEEEIVEAARQARQARKDAEGNAAAELHRRGWTWERIGEALGVNQSTVHRWARPYLRETEA